MHRILFFLIGLALGAMAPIAFAADTTIDINLYTETDAELANHENTCVLPTTRTDGRELPESEITAIHWYTCLNCSSPGDPLQPNSAFTLQQITIHTPGAVCQWPRDFSTGYTDGDVETVRAVAEATDGGGGTLESILSPDRAFFVFAGARPLAQPSPPAGIGGR